MPFDFKSLEIPEVISVQPGVFEDERGFFMETYKMPDFASSGIRGNFVQENHSHSTKGVLRGLHYQNPPFAQGKLVRAVRGYKTTNVFSPQSEAGIIGERGSHLRRRTKYT